jgi:hypothetical protein
MSQVCERRETGRKSGMKEPHKEGVANRFGRESCELHREVHIEA